MIVMRKENGLKAALAGGLASAVVVLSPASAGAAGGGAGMAAAAALRDAIMAPEAAMRVEVPAYYGELDRAEALLAAGAYRTVASALSDAERSRRVRRILAEANWRLGRLEAAAELLEGLDDEAATVLAARVEFDRPDFEGAAARLDAFIDENPRALRARLLRGQIAEQVGDLELAREAYGWFVDQGYLRKWVSDPDATEFELADDVVTIATALDRFATLEGEYAQDSSLHDVIYGMFVRAYDVIDRGNIPARLAAAQFSAERGDRAKAAEDLERVLQANPNHPEALELLGTLALAGWDFGRAKDATLRMRWFDAASARADRLEAETLLLQRQPDRAEPIAGRLLERNPDDLEALGLTAAVAALRLEETAMDAALDRVEALDPDNATAYYTVGRHLATMRQYPRAQAMLSKAVERAPWWMQPRNELGLLLTQSGQEAESIEVLREARQLDPFNVETLNFLTLLEELATYDELETERFVIQYDESKDPLVAEVLAESLDVMGKDVERIYGWSPAEKTRIQVFPTHDRFSVRVAGDPYVGTVGACTGPVIAMVTPRDGAETMGSYDWAQVIRHEFTHTITLGRTENRIYHWMTEGIAVREEQAPMRQEWLALLSEAYNNDELFPVADLTWGFVRPEKPTERSLAYAQSWLVCEYIFERWGEEVLDGLLDAAKAGRTEAEAFRAVLDIDLDEFDKDFRERMRQHVEAWGTLPEQTADYEELVREAEAAVKARELTSAAEKFEAARKIRPLDEQPLRRLAGIYMTGETRDEEKALEMLLALHERTTDDNRFAKTAARLLLRQEETEQARDLAEEAVEMAPYDAAAHALLLEAEEVLGNEQAVERQRRRLEILAGMSTRPE